MSMLLLSLLLSLAHGEATPVKPFLWTRGNIEFLKTRLPAGMFQYEDTAAERRRDLDEGYLPPRERDALFRRLSLETKLKGMDELDKDMLIMGAKSYTVPELVKQYPMLNSAQLRRLKTAVENYK
jgi:hypothetical protein